MTKKNKKPKSDEAQADAEKPTQSKKEKTGKGDRAKKTKSPKPDQTTTTAQPETPPVETSLSGDAEKTPEKKEEPIKETAKTGSMDQKPVNTGETKTEVKPEDTPANEVPEDKTTLPAEDEQPEEPKKSAFRFAGLFLFIFIIGGAITVFNLTKKEKPSSPPQKPPVEEQKAFAPPVEPAPPEQEMDKHPVLTQDFPVEEIVVEENHISGVMAKGESQGDHVSGVMTSPEDSETASIADPISGAETDEEFPVEEETVLSFEETAPEEMEPSANDADDSEIALAPQETTEEAVPTPEEVEVAPAEESREDTPAQEEEIDDSKIALAPVEAEEETPPIEEPAEDVVEESSAVDEAVPEAEPAEEPKVMEAEEPAVASEEVLEEPAEEADGLSHDEEPVQVAEAVETAPEDETAHEEPTVERSKEVKNYLDFVETSAKTFIEFIEKALAGARKFFEGF